MSEANVPTAPVNSGMENFLLEQDQQRHITGQAFAGAASGYVAGVAVSHLLAAGSLRPPASSDGDETLASSSKEAGGRTGGAELVRRVGWIGATLVTVFVVYGVWAFDPGSTVYVWGQIIVIASLHAFLSRRPVLRTLYTALGAGFVFLVVVTGISNLLSGLSKRS